MARSVAGSFGSSLLRAAFLVEGRQAVHRVGSGLALFLRRVGLDAPGLVLRDEGLEPLDGLVPRLLELALFDADLVVQTAEDGLLLLLVVERDDRGDRVLVVAGPGRIGLGLLPELIVRRELLRCRRRQRRGVRLERRDRGSRHGSREVRRARVRRRRGAEAGVCAPCGLPTRRSSCARARWVCCGACVAHGSSPCIPHAARALDTRVGPRAVRACA